MSAWPLVVGYLVRCVEVEANGPSRSQIGDVARVAHIFDGGKFATQSGICWSVDHWELVPPTDPAWRPPVFDPPSTIRVGPHRYRVSFDADEHAEAQREEKNALYGQADHSKLRIVIDPELPPDQQADTLLHELLHCLTTHTGIVDDLGSKREERMVGRLAPALLDALRRNPALVAYLTSEGP